MKCETDPEGGGHCWRCKQTGVCFNERCHYCDRRALNGEITCGSEKCLQIERELNEERKRVDREQLRKAVISAIRDRCKCDENWGLNRLQRWFYTGKFLACVLFRLRRCRDYKEDDPVEVGRFHYQELYAGWEADWCVVGHGVLKGWFYQLEHDGDWNM